VVEKDQNKNINLECSSGFYAQVAKPTLFSLSQDHIPPVLGISILCDNIIKNLDGLGHEYNRAIFFKLGHANGNSRKVTIHAHLSTRLVQVQGGALIPDKLACASWFVKNVLYGKFQLLAKAKSYTIARFNDAITNMGETSTNAFKKTKKMRNL
jgi:hypothetical protein